MYKQPLHKDGTPSRHKELDVYIEARAHTRKHKAQTPTKVAYYYSLRRVYELKVFVFVTKPHSEVQFQQSIYTRHFVDAAVGIVSKGWLLFWNVNYILTIRDFLNST